MWALVANPSIYVEGKSLLFFLSYAQKVGVWYPPLQKVGGGRTRTPRTPVNYAYMTKWLTFTLYEWLQFSVKLQTENYKITFCLRITFVLLWISRPALILMFWRSIFKILLVGWVVGLGFKLCLDNGCQPSVNGSPRNLYTSWKWSQALKPSFEFFSPS